MRIEVTTEERERIIRARAFAHGISCPRTVATSCAACPTPLGTLMALRVLDTAPRDMRAVRRALHDVVCASGCGPDSDHADRTQAKVAAALRRFVASEVGRMNDAQDAASYAWPPLTPAEYLEDELVFCRDGSLLKDATSSRARCGVNCLGVAAA